MQMPEVGDFYRQRMPPVAIESIEQAEHAYASYLSYVKGAVECAPSRFHLLEVGCGVGWSSALMAQAGFAGLVVGVDLGSTFLNGSVTAKVAFIRADALSLPFGLQSFDAVACYQFLEHIPEPGRALDEMVHVLKPGGVLIVAGPNLLSPLCSLWALVRWLPTRSLRRWFMRDSDELRWPFGSTLPEIAFTFLRNVALLLKKTWSPSVTFVFRAPDLREPAYADTDACYLLNPIDVRKYLSQHGLRILRYQDGGRLRLGKLGVLKGGTWVVARKPTATG